MSIRDELLALENADGMIEARAAVEWARDNPASALHGSLTWDDAEAAEEYRVWQVRRLIKLHIVAENGEPQMVSLSVDRKATGGYRPISEVIKSKDLKSVMLADALAELERVRTRYARLQALAGVWREVDKVRDADAKKAARPRLATARKVAIQHGRRRNTEGNVAAIG